MSFRVLIVNASDHKQTRILATNFHTRVGLHSVVARKQTLLGRYLSPDKVASLIFGRDGVLHHQHGRKQIFVISKILFVNVVVLTNRKMYFMVRVEII